MSTFIDMPGGSGLNTASQIDCASFQLSSPKKANHKRKLPLWMLNLSQAENVDEKSVSQKRRKGHDSTQIKRGRVNTNNSNEDNETFKVESSNLTINSLACEKKNTIPHAISDSDNSEGAETNSTYQVKNIELKYEKSEVENSACNINSNTINSEIKNINGGLGSTTSDVCNSETSNRDESENCRESTKNVESESKKNETGIVEDDKNQSSNDNHLFDNAQSSDDIQKQLCKYGTKCYRKNVQHLRDFSHPGDEDYELTCQDIRPECEYGTTCYRKNPLHRQHYKHTKILKTKKQQHASGSSDDDYDYDDPFLNDGSSDDYQPTDTSSDSDLSNIGSNIDSEEENDSKRMKKEAKHFLRNKNS